MWESPGPDSALRKPGMGVFRPNPMADTAVRARVLIAEDSVLIQESIRHALRTCCEIVAAVEDGQAVWQALDAHTPDVLVLDISLPDINGFVIAEKLKQIGSPVKVVFVTAHSEKIYADRAFEIGVDGYVVKGGMHTELPAAIRAVTSGGFYRSPRVAGAAG